MRLLVATGNKGKLREIKEILKGLGLCILSLDDLKKRFRIVENGKTFCSNASKKALAISKAYKDIYVVGEDSGLEVDYLKGKPGVHSRRYSGLKSTSEKNNRKLLKALSGVRPRDRKAKFICCLVLAYRGVSVKVFNGELAGIICAQSQGKGGFGYDPVFYLAKHQRTVAQIPLKLKNKISHRAKAFNKLRDFLKNHPH